MADESDFINKLILVPTNECYEVSQVAFHNEMTDETRWVTEPKIINALCLATNASPTDEYIWDDFTEFVADYFGSDAWEYMDFATPEEASPNNCPINIVD